MLADLEKLLILQDRDRRLIRMRAEAADVDPQRRLASAHLAGADQEAEAAKLAFQKLESERKRLELEVEAKKELIAKYAAQQWQTRKNEEYKALGHEIETCKRAIRDLEDLQIGVMEQIEAAEKRTAAALEAQKKAREDVRKQLEHCDAAEVRLRKQLADAEAARAEAAAAVGPLVLPRYERILKNRGDKVVVGVERGVCGGCHMKLARQDVLNTQNNLEIVNCPNCGRILYFTPDMDVRPQD